MSLLYDIDKVVECVKTIFDSSRCVVCDKSGGARLRYSCGHTTCDNCVVGTEDCLICLTPSEGTVSKPVHDNVLTNRAENATSLLKACQETFRIDVCKRKRISDQLKVEKELFPECIQAPQKYGNKRKSLNTCSKNKENKSTFFPGEDTSLHRKMENSVNYVHQWLNKNEKNLIRKPFRDLNSCDPRLQIKPALKNQIKTKNNENREITSKKRTFKTDNSVFKHQNILENVVAADSSAKNKKRKKHDGFPKETAIKEKVQELINDESGIVIDDDDPIIIDDSQITIDKDRDALLAVLEADRNQKDFYSILSLNSKDIENSGIERTNAKTKKYHVPFIKKGYLFETSHLYYSNDVQGDKIDLNKSITPPKEVCITIDNNSFTTVIKVCHEEQNRNIKCGKHSMSVQTEITESIKLDYDDKKSVVDNITFQPQRPRKENNSVHLEAMPSQELFTYEGNKTIESDYRLNVDKSDMIGNKRKVSTQGITIEDSDSDESNNEGGLMEVTADIHRSCDEIDYGVLTVIGNLGEHENRARRPARGLTPDSSNSSEKENFNPNRPKKIKGGKKGICKKI